MTHYILFDTGRGNFEEKDLGTNLNKALKDAMYWASHLTRSEMKQREEFSLVACEVPEDADLDEIIYSDYATKTIRDYKQGIALYTAVRETGDFIDMVDTIEDGRKLIEAYEAQDRKEGTYEENFYDIVNEDHISVI